jgi:hypothetical protein
LLLQGGRSRVEFVMLHLKPWPRFAMKKTTKWSIPNTDTFRTELVKESMLWCCPLKVVTAYDALCDQVKLTHALTKDLNEVVKEIQ